MSSAEDQWRKVLMTGHRPLVISRRVWRHVPSAPRCKVCGNPFGGIGGRIARVAGYSPSRKNPNLCARCCDALPRGGAEVDIGVLFADVRGSTALGERTSASDYAGLLNRFYAVATDVLLRHDALIDKLIGDQAMALFIPGVAGRDYRRKAVEAAVAVVHGVGYGSFAGPWLTVGVGVNAGQAYVGNIGGQRSWTSQRWVTPSTSPRSCKRRRGAGKSWSPPMCTIDALLPGADRRTLQLRGHETPVPVFVASL